MTKVIISTPLPGKIDVSGASIEYGFGYCEAQGLRETQEDALAWQIFTDQLHPANSSTPLTPTEIGHRLWTSYQVIDKVICGQKHTSGSTAATTVYDGNGNLITALLADAAAFAAVYNKKGEAIGVVRLNSTTHKPDDATEKARIVAALGCIINGRVYGDLAITRAIGDKIYKDSITSEATIDITSINKIKTDLIKNNPAIKMEDIGNIQIITTCDGYTDMAEGGSKSNNIQQENHLLSQLKTKGALAGTMNEEELSKYLVEVSREKNGVQNRDNISVSIQTITDKTPAFFTGVYDGHAGAEASRHIAQNIGENFLEQCALSKEAYAAQELSVNKRQAIFDRDHKHLQNVDISAAATPAVPTKPEIAAKPVAAPTPSASEKPKPVSPASAINSGNEPTPTKKPDAKASIVPLVGNEADKNEIARIRKVLKDFRDDRKKPDLSTGSSKKARDQLEVLQRNLDNACDIYERDLGLKAPHSKTQAENAFKRNCKNHVSAALSDGLADDLNWGDYLINLVKCLCNVIIAKVSANTNQFFSYATSPLEKDVDAHVNELINKESDKGKKL